MERKIRVLLTKVGLDCHTHGISIIARALRDAGMEVIYLGPYQTPESIVKSAIQEDVDAIGISSMSGGHMLPCTEICRLARENNLEVLIIGGGFFPRYDVEALKKAGVAEIFGPGTSTVQVAKFIQENTKDKIKSK